MQKIRLFVKNQIILVIVTAAAAASCFFVPPDAQYAGYINFQVLAVLFCLMGVVAGLSRAGAVGAVTRLLTRKAGTTRSMGLVLTFLSFFLAMFITNDVTLVAVVPMTIAVFAGKPQKFLIYTLVMETVAANLGGMLLPTGNPQNLFLYTAYGMDFQGFVLTLLPCWLVSLALIFVMTLLPRSEPLTLPPEDGKAVPSPRGFRPWMHGALFVLCLLAVIGLVPYPVCLAAVCLCLLLFDRPVFAKIDYPLLLTFVAFFIFVGNLSRIDAVRQAAASLLEGRELIAGIAVSQVCSNVPAAMMLSGFTQNAAPLLIGVNLGGLGTLIASMASLITYGLYARSPGARKGRFLLVFTLVNFGMLAVLTAFALLF